MCLDPSYLFTPGVGHGLNPPGAHGLSVGGGGSPEKDKEKLPAWQTDGREQKLDIHHTCSGQEFLNFQT